MIPHADDMLDDWRAARRTRGRMLVALDFDGTLAPIVPSPDDAAPLPAARAAVARLGQRRDTQIAIVSGRALDDVRARIELDDVYYAGNHGMEIRGPGVERMHPEAAAARPKIAACADALGDAVGDIEGVLVEDKELTLSVHYRRVEDPVDKERVRDAVERICGDEPALRLTYGKETVEVRPDIDWDKGHATRFLLDTLEDGADEDVPALFFGDDRTDEDGFRVTRERAGAVIVADPPPPPEETLATAWLRSPREVATLLGAFAEAR